MPQPPHAMARNTPCAHASPSAKTHFVHCRLGLFGGTPHQAICRSCKQYVPGSVPAVVATLTVAPRLKTPRPWTPEERALAETRIPICQSCPHNRGVTVERNNWPVYTVRCGLCGCSGLSLVRGTCHAGRWPAVTTPQPSTQGNASSSTPPPAPAPPKAGAQKLLLRSFLSPGDIVMLTATVRDLHKAYPGRFLTHVNTSANDLWEHNPWLTPFDVRDPGVRSIEMHYPLINQSNQRPLHFIHGYTEYLEKQLGLPIPVTAFKGDIHLSEEEKGWTHQVEETFGYKGRYWILMAGGKHDFTTKWWSPDAYQQVVQGLLGKVQFVQCGEKHHWHPELQGVFNMVGKTSLRQFIRLMYHAAGVVCPVTMAMHLAAAVPTKGAALRPCVVIAGGREPPHWEAYPGHQFLHTIGMLSCCATGGCWKSRCQKRGDGDIKERDNLCERPVPVRPDLLVPQCMTLIEPRDVIRAVERYLLAT